jgi:hypothetical protein
MKPLLTLTLGLLFTGIFGQNLQLHYDFSRRAQDNNNQNYLTSTFEMFRPDSMGSTFWFVDVDFNGKSNEPSLLYFEIARDIRFKGLPVGLHVEYNGGFMFNQNAANFGANFPHVGIVGVSGGFRIKNSSIGYYLAYRYDNSAQSHADAQLTLTWFVPFANGKIHFTGFCDFWTQFMKTNSHETERKIVFLTEPQIWLNLTEKLALGGELEISKNFVFGSDNMEFFPTLALKYTF